MPERRGWKSFFSDQSSPMDGCRGVVRSPCRGRKDSDTDRARQDRGSAAARREDAFGLPPLHSAGEGDLQALGELPFSGLVGGKHYAYSSGLVSFE